MIETAWNAGTENAGFSAPSNDPVKNRRRLEGKPPYREENTFFLWILMKNISKTLKFPLLFG